MYAVVHATERKYFRHSTLVNRVQSTRSLLLLRKHHTGLSTLVPSGKRGIQLTVLCNFVVVVYKHPQRHPGDIGGGAKGRVSGGGRSPAGRCRSGGREEPTGRSAPTAAEIKAALEENPAMLQELGLAWVRNASEISHAFQLPPHVTAQNARVVADLEKALATAEAEAAVHAATTREAAASVRSLRENAQSDVGRRTYQAALSVLVGTGERSEGVSSARRAASLGIRPQTFRDAEGRMKSARHDLPPAEAVAQGAYVYNERKTRSDATSEELVVLMRQFWHSDDVSRATGNSGEITCGESRLSYIAENPTLHKFINLWLSVDQ